MNDTSKDNEKYLFTIFNIKSNNLMFHFDPRDSTVKVPEHFKQSSKLTLEFGYKMAVNISDMIVSEGGIGGTLTFNRFPHYCFVPWNKIYCIVLSGTFNGREWLDDAPKDNLELNNIIAKSKRDNFKVLTGNSEPSNLKRKPPKLTLVK